MNLYETIHEYIYICFYLLIPNGCTCKLNSGNNNTSNNNIGRKIFSSRSRSSSHAGLQIRVVWSSSVMFTIVFIGSVQMFPIPRRRRGVVNMRRRERRCPLFLGERRWELKAPKTDRSACACFPPGKARRCSEDKGRVNQRAGRGVEETHER